MAEQFQLTDQTVGVGGLLPQVVVLHMPPDRVTSKDHLKRLVNRCLRSLQRTPRLIRGFFYGPQSPDTPSSVLAGC